jgi:hypothetical protein
MYLRGLTDGLFLMKAFDAKGSAGCLPAEMPISTAEAKRDLELFLQGHPEAMGNSAGLAAVAAITQAYPCSRK